MENSYTLNKELQRLEPKETLCQYCQNEHSKSMEENYYCPVFKEKDRTNLIVYRSVKFNKLKIGIPRCSNCFSIHQKNFQFGRSASIFITIILGVIIYLIFGVYVLFYLPFGPAIILVLGPRFLAKELTHRQNLPAEEEGAEQDKTIKNMLNGGWSLKPPNA